MQNLLSDYVETLILKKLNSRPGAARIVFIHRYFLTIVNHSPTCRQSQLIRQMRLRCP